MEQNKTQDQLAASAGIGRSTLSLLERGETVTVSTLIQVLRVLDQLPVLSTFELRPVISPLALAKQQKKIRQRARNKSGKEAGNEDTNW
jgi:transcriptional regulator with XRE-family HTH domain